VNTEEFLLFSSLLLGNLSNRFELGMEVETAKRMKKITTNKNK